MYFISKFSRLFCWTLVFFSAYSSFSQGNCGSDGVHQFHLLKNPAYYNAYKQTELNYQSYMKKRTILPSKNAKVVGSVYYLPVVVHIVHDNGAENIPDAQVLNAISYLNDAFRHIAPYNGPNGVDTEIEFCLAKQDPIGNPTSGINRIVSAADTEIPYYDAGQDLALKDQSRWDPTKYINIWVIKNIIGSTAGYAYLPPGGIGSNYDGIVVEYNYMGTSKSNNNVLVHEMGHYLGLKHTFEGGCPNNNCLVDGDGICDTPPDATKFTCTGNSCITDIDDVTGSNPFRPTGMGGLGDQNDMSNNYMDYSSFSCQNAFSQGQKDRMRFFTDPIAGGRKLLHSSLGCELPCSTPITGSFTFVASITSGSLTTFTNTTVGATNYEWYINGTLISTANNLSYTFTNGGTYTIELVAKNAEISCTQTSKQILNVVCPSLGASFSASATTIDVGNSINFTNLTTSILDTTGKNNWFINNVLMATSKDFLKTFSTKGTYIIKLVVGASSTSCTSEFLLPIIVNCPAHADFTATANDVPITTTVGFTNSGTFCSTNEWLIDNSSFGTAPTLSHTFPLVGEYLVALVCDNGVCKDTAYRVVNVYDPFSCGANKRANYWYFGGNAGINFNSGLPVALFDGAMASAEGVSTVSSKNGSLLFYTNGVKVWNKTHSVMPSGTGLMGATTSTQSALIVPKPGSDTLYYIFTTDSLGENGLRGLRYSVVNINLNGGLGDVITTQKNILIELNSNEQVTAIQHGNTCDLWIVAHRSGTNEYLSYLLSSTGLSLSPIVSTPGSINQKFYSYGYLKGSHDGKKIASSFGIAGVELSDFDNFTGIVSNSGILIAPNSDDMTYGIEFSPNSQLLYVSSTGFTSGVGGLVRKINQYNLSAGTISAINSSVYLVVAEYLGQLGGTCGALQLATNGKIYVAIPNAAFLSSIEVPDAPLAGCTYSSASTPLTNPGRATASKRGLPAIYPSALQLANINFTCSATGITFSYKGNITNPDTYFWEFGDPTSGTLNYSNDANPTHLYTGTGSFTIKLIVKKQCLCATGNITINMPVTCTLPFNLLLFNGKRKSTSVTLNWTNEKESTVKYYEIERKFESINEFSTIRLEGKKNNCSTACNHEIVDILPTHLTNETVYYRLKITDNNDQITYSTVIHFEPYTFENSSVKIFPNPLGFGQSLSIEASNENIESIQLMDLSGKIIVEKHFKENKIAIESLQLTSGMYLVKITTDGTIHYQRLIVSE